MDLQCLRLILAVCLTAGSAVRASAQPIFAHVESIEATVNNAERVVIGRIVEIGTTGEREEGCEVSIAVERSLKGGHQETGRLRMYQSTAELQAWLDQSARLLIAWRDEAPQKTRVIDLSTRELEALTADLTVLRNAAAVVRTAENEVRRHPGIIRMATFRLLVPIERLAETKWAPYHGTCVHVPIDDRLETRAIEYLRSDRYLERCEGVRALRYFRSDENIARVKTMLDDQGWAYLYHPAHNDGVEVRRYGVRLEAYETLSYWGVQVDKPMTDFEIRE